MPRFFFNVHDGERYDDVDGTICKDLHDAKREASRLASELLAAHPDRFWNGEVWTIDIADSDSRRVTALRLTGTSSDTAS